MSERLGDVPVSPLLEKRKGGTIARRLIDANALMDEIKNRCIMPEWCKTLVRSVVIDLPTIEERKTGKWIQDPKSKRYRCDQCMSFALRTDDGKENLSDFCPVCGAKMEGEQHG